MAETVATGHELDEAAEVLEGDNLATVDLAYFGFGAKAVDLLLRDGKAVGVGGVNANGTVVFDVDLATGLVADALDVLATRADEGTDLVRVNLDGDDPWSVGAHFLSRSGDGLFHRVDDLKAGFLRVNEGFAHDLAREAFELQVQLKAGDALLGAGDLAVHVTEGVFPTDDVGEDFVATNRAVVIFFRADTDGDAADGGGHGNTGIHERQGGATNGGHRAGTVGFQDFTHNTNGVREVVERDDRSHAAFSKRAMTDLTTTWSHDPAGFTDGEVREVVMQHELLGIDASRVGIEVLGIIGGTQRGDGHGLGFAAREDGRTVRARQNANVAGDFANIAESPAILTLSIVEDEGTNLRLLDAVKHLAHDLVRDLFLTILLDELGFDLILDGRTGLLAHELLGNEERVTNAGGKRLRVFQNLVLDGERGDFALRLTGFFDQFDLGGDQRLDGFLSELQGLVEFFVRNFVGGSFKHHNIVLVANVDKIEVTAFHLFMRGIGDKLATDTTDANTTKRSGPRDVTDGQRGGGTQDAHHIRFIFTVGAEEERLHLHFVEPAFRKQRTDRTIRKAHGENFLLGRTTFTLEITTGETTGGRSLFAVIDGEWEEVLSCACLVSGTSGDEDDGLAHGNRNGTIGLFGKIAGFYMDFLSADRGGYFGD